jgi:hypothetical protein
VYKRCVQYYSPTELVLLMDIDFLLSRELNDVVLDPDRRVLTGHALSSGA